MELSDRQAVFVGFKLDGSLRRQLDYLEGPDRRYVDDPDHAFLTICTVGEDRYVGKIVTEPLTTDRVDDVKRNVLSIMQRLCPDTRLPAQLEIRPVVPAVDPDADTRDVALQREQKPPYSGGSR